ncbi:MAG: Coenzyme F420 hydrogenase/dehydrogenase, beta subunit C-terminal domain [Pseudomonadota bacterium]
MAKRFLLELKNGTAREALNIFLENLLIKERVAAILVPQEHPSGKGIMQSLVTDPDKVKNAEPFVPFMPVNAAVLISRITKVSPSKRGIAAVLKPCEIRAVVELAKLKQINLDNIFLIGTDCIGTYPTVRYEELKASGYSTPEGFIKNRDEAKIDGDIRDACRICLYPTPISSDLFVGFLGMDGKDGLLIQVETEKGERSIEGIHLKEIHELHEREGAVATLLEERRQKREAILKSTQEEVSGIENLLSFFAPCINCHNCRTVCPVCYCRECFLDSATFEFEADKYFDWAEKTGSLKMPTDNLLFHLTRMVHMGSLCVGCGLCQDACPKDIPLGRLFPFIGSKIQKIFEYVPGRNPDEELPMATFKEEELKEIGYR